MSVEGIPNGWRLVRVGRVCYGETRIDSNGNPLKWTGVEPSQLKNFVIIEMVKDAKQYREPELSDLANGPIEIEACTPDPHTGERRWRKRKLVAIQTGGRKPFVVQHPNQPGLVVCYKEARIEVVASSEAPPTDHIADADKMIPLAIPAGWRQLQNGEELSKADLYECDGKWNPYTDSNPAGSDFPEYNKAIHYRHIRKIESEKPSKTPNSSIPDPGPCYRLLSKDPPEPVVEGDDFWCDTYWEESDNWRSGGRQCSSYYRRKIEQAPQAEQVPDVKLTIYREPTQRDLANGPIRCRVRDSKECKWLIMNLYAVLPERVKMRFVAMRDAGSLATTWKYCEIPSDHQAIRVGDLVKVTARPVGVYRVGWVNEMNRQVGKVAKVSGITHDGRFLLNGCGGWRFHRDWLELVETASEAKGGQA